MRPHSFELFLLSGVFAHYCRKDPELFFVTSDGGMYQQKKSLKRMACRMCFVVVSVVCTLRAYAGVVEVV